MTDYMTVRDTATLLKVSPRRVLTLIYHKRIKAIRLCWAWYVDAASAQSYVPGPVGRPKGTK